MDGLKNKYSQEQIDRILEIKNAVSDSCTKIDLLILEKAKEMKLSPRETWLFRNRTISAMFAECYQIGISIEKNIEQLLNTETMKNETNKKTSPEKKERKTTKNH